MKLSEEMAVRLHRMMWSDMQEELGDKPSEKDRLAFKSEWIEKNFPGQDVLHRCFLCEYAQQMYSDKDFGICRNCPIVWPGGFCNGVIKSYATMPISEILALPAKNESFATKAVNIHDLSRDIVVGEVAKASGLPVECDIWSHIKAIQDKAKEKAAVGSYYQYREELLSKASGIPAICSIDDHVKAIKEKAVEEYFEERPGAKLASMDVDDAFKQYAKEQMEPLKQKIDSLTKRYIAVKDYLAKQSGLDHDRPVDDHIREIVKNSMEAGATEERDRIQEKIYEVLLS